MRGETPACAATSPIRNKVASTVHLLASSGTVETVQAAGGTDRRDPLTGGHGRRTQPFDAGVFSSVPDDLT
ncbi:hypothetical protein GCM10027615_45450 [Plantactinospora veratri]